MSQWSWSSRRFQSEYPSGPGARLMRGIHPVRRDIMDVGPTAAAELSADLVPADKTTRTRTIREYEQTIQELKKENFDLKLRLFLHEEGKNKVALKDKDSLFQDEVQVIVQMKMETESLQKELEQKDKDLQEAINRCEQYALTVNELSEKCAQLEKQCSSMAEVPAKDNIDLLFLEKENVLQRNKDLEKNLQQKCEEIELAKQQIEALADEISKLEEKKKKRNQALQSLLIRDQQEKERFPCELKAIAISAVQAAKNGRKEELVATVKKFSTALSQVLNSVSAKEFSRAENLQSKCLEEKSFDHRSMSLPSQTINDLSAQQTDQTLDDPNSQVDELECFIRNSFLKGTPVSENRLAEKDIINIIDFSRSCSTPTDKIVPQSLGKENSQFAAEEDNSVNIQNVVSATKSLVSMQQKQSVSPGKSSLNVEVERVIQENIELKEVLKRKSAIINKFTDELEALKSKGEDDAKKGFDASQPRYLEPTRTDEISQTNVSFYQLRDIAKLKDGAHLPENVPELQANILLLLLIVDEKTKELSDVKQALSLLQESQKPNLDGNQYSVLDEASEINELHERLAFSCSVNSELIKHLRSLEAFMEDLLQHKQLSTSMESISSRSSFLSNVSKCLNESLKLSNALSDHLSFCEGSKLFEEYKSMLSQSHSMETGFPTLDATENSLSEHHRAEFKEGVQVKAHGPSKTYTGQELGFPSENPFCKKYHLQMTLGTELAHRGCPSSDSDIWSEPDRDVSMQRIGIALPISPKASKSPRRLKNRDRRRSHVGYDTSTSDVQPLGKHKPNGSVHRKLFDKHAYKEQFSFLEKYYSFLSDKLLKLKTLLNKNIDPNYGDITPREAKHVESVILSLDKTLQTLQIVKDNIKSSVFSSCGKCAIYEFLLVLNNFPEYHGLCMDPKSLGFVQIVNEIDEMKEECCNLFPILPEHIQDASKSTKSCSSIDLEKISDLEELIAHLEGENKELVDDVEVKQKLLAEKEASLELVKAENLKLCQEADNLKRVISDLQSKGNELSQENTELIRKLDFVINEKNNLCGVLENLEQLRTESDSKLDQLTSDLQKNKSELVNMSLKCLELEKELSEKAKEEATIAEYQNRQAFLSKEIKKYEVCNQNLKIENNNLVNKLSSYEEKISSLQRENASLKDCLTSKESELSSLLSDLQSLKNAENELSNNFAQLQSAFENSQKRCADLCSQCRALEEEVARKTKNEKEYCEQLKRVEETFLFEKNKIISEITTLTSEKDNALQELTLKEKELDQLLTENKQLHQKLFESCQQAAFLRSVKEKLENDHTTILKEKENIQTTLISSDSKCAVLDNNLNHLNGIVQNLESKCSSLEKQLLRSDRVKKSLVECLFCIIDEVTNLKQKIVEICRACDINFDKIPDNDIDSTISLNFDESNVGVFCSSVGSECQRLSSTVDSVLEIIKQLSLTSKDVHLMQEKYAVQLSSANKRIELQKHEIEHLVQQNAILKQAVDENDKSVSKDVSYEPMNASAIISLKDQLNTFKAECDKHKQLLGKKDDEIITLQEKLSLVSKEMHSIQEKNALQLNCVKEQVEVQKREIEHLTQQNNLLKHPAEEKAVSRDASLEPLSTSKVSPLKGQFQKVETDFDKQKQLLLSKDDEIAALQEKLSSASKDIYSIQEQYALQLNSIQKHVELQKREIECLVQENNLLKKAVDEQSKVESSDVSSEPLTKSALKSLKDQLLQIQADYAKQKQSLAEKDDQITALQEKVFNLQTFINAMLEEKNKSNHQLASDASQLKPGLKKNSGSSQLESSNLTPDFVSQSLKEQDLSSSAKRLSPAIPERRHPSAELDDSSASLSSHKSSCCDKYYRKCHSLQKKVTLLEKRIQILEEEKARLREFHGSNSVLGRTDEARKVSELDAALQQKKNFISELKAELLKACNSLIDKERELDAVKSELKELEKKLTLSSSASTKHVSPESPKAVDANIKNLANYKWSLLQNIFDVQKSFYESKGIHLSHFEQFKDHINKINALQCADALSKSVSLPHLDLSSVHEEVPEPCDYKYKHLISLELDIECLENLKIFLSRFFMPSVVSHETDSQSTQTEDYPRKLKLKLPKFRLDKLPTDLNLSDVEMLLWSISQHIDVIKDFFDAIQQCKQFPNAALSSTSNKDEISLVMEIASKTKKLRETVSPLFRLNSSIKELEFFTRKISKIDASDQESVISEETITLSRSETPVSTDEVFQQRFDSPRSQNLERQTVHEDNIRNQAIVDSSNPCRIKALSSSCDSVHHRSQYSSPDLGIESDPNHEGSAPEQKGKEKFSLPQSSSAFPKENSSKCRGSLFIGDQLHSVCTLSNYELLKREIQESLVGIRSVLSRTGDGLNQIVKYASPRRTLEYSSMKAIKDSCTNIEVCLKKANAIIGKFWTAHCPSEHEWNMLVEENRTLYQQLSVFKDSIQNQKAEFQEAMEKLEHAQVLKAKMERKISKKLVKTKKVIRNVEMKLLENQCQNCPPLPKYPFDANQQGN